MKINTSEALRRKLELAIEKEMSVSGDEVAWAKARAKVIRLAKLTGMDFNAAFDWGCWGVLPGEHVPHGGPCNEQCGGRAS
jgi:hypothetical protein